MKKVFTSFVVVAAFMSVAGCKVKQTQEGEMPKVDVKTSGGQLPEYNVKGPNVQVGEKTETVKVPTVKVKAPE